jgi:transposase
MSIKDIAQLVSLGWDTVKDIIKKHLTKRFDRVPLKHLRRIAVDEVYLGAKAKYVTLVIDLDTGHVVWTGMGRGKDALADFWPKLRASGAQIQAAACDMSAAYWSAIMEHLPEADLVFDRFHIVKLVNTAIDETRRGIQRVLDATGRKFLKGKRYLLLRGKNNLTPEQTSELEEALKFNEPLFQAHYLKEELRALWDQGGRRQGSKHLTAWIKLAQDSGLTHLKRVARTLELHTKQILNYFSQPITTGKLEGINNKVGRMTRLAYGYRDTEFLLLRIKSMHESKSKMTGI